MKPAERKWDWRVVESIRRLSGESWDPKLSSRAPEEEQTVGLALNPSARETETDLWGSMASHLTYLASERLCLEKTRCLRSDTPDLHVTLSHKRVHTCARTHTRTHAQRQRCLCQMEPSNSLAWAEPRNLQFPGGTLHP